MATTYPTTLDQYDPVPRNQQQAVKHHERHQNVEDAIEAIEEYVGTEASADPDSITYKIENGTLPFIQSGPGSITRTSRAKMRETVTPEDKGAVADGVTDDTLAFNNAAATGGLVELPGTVYKLDTAPTMGDSTLLARNLQALIGAGATNLELLNFLGFQNGYLGGNPIASDLRTSKIEILSGVIRQNPADRTKWDFIADAGHVPSGFQTGPANVVASGGTLTLTFRKTYKRVMTLLCVPDETLASQWGINCGASVSLDSAAINMSINREVAGIVWFDGAAWQHKVTSMGNSTVGGTPVFAAGTLTVPHAFVPGIDGTVQLIPYSRNGAVLPVIPSLKSAGTLGVADSQSAFTMFFQDFAGALIAAAATTMSFTYTRRACGPIRVDNTGGTVNTPLSDGNIWLFGIMEAF